NARLHQLKSQSHDEYQKNELPYHDVPHPHYNRKYYREDDFASIFSMHTLIYHGYKVCQVYEQMFQVAQLLLIVKFLLYDSSVLNTNEMTLCLQVFPSRLSVDYVIHLLPFLNRLVTFLKD